VSGLFTLKSTNSASLHAAMSVDAWTEMRSWKWMLSITSPLRFQTSTWLGRPMSVTWAPARASIPPK
jgi:hypothetical protein